MSDETAILTPIEVARLASDPSPENRAAVASRLADQYDQTMEAREKKLTEDIFRVLLRDVEVRVRAAMAESLKHNTEVPHDVALALARDVAEVATPILQHSEALPEEDLIAIIGESSVAHQVAVACRQNVSERVAEALAETQEEDVVVVLLANDDVDLSERVLATVIDTFGDNERINDPMVRRKWLPLSISERLVSLVSERLQAHLVTHHELPSDTASDLVRESRERATMSLIDDDSSELDVTTLVEQLASNDRLTPTIVLHSICLGDRVFFEAAMARLCGITLVNANKLIDDGGDNGLRAVCARAGLPRELQPIIRAAVEVARETDYDGPRPRPACVSSPAVGGDEKPRLDGDFSDIGHRGAVAGWFAGGSWLGAAVGK